MRQGRETPGPSHPAPDPSALDGHGVTEPTRHSARAESWTPLGMGRGPAGPQTEARCLPPPGPEATPAAPLTWSPRGRDQLYSAACLTPTTGNRGKRRSRPEGGREVRGIRLWSLGPDGQGRGEGLLIFRFFSPSVKRDPQPCAHISKCVSGFTYQEGFVWYLREINLHKYTVFMNREQQHPSHTHQRELGKTGFYQCPFFS